jgi:methylated-DNA-[protein]-cysteine S-methyltransferase
VQASVNEQVSTTAVGWTVFPTALGSCAVAWSGRGLVGVCLPEPSESTLRWRVARRWPTAPQVDDAPPAVRAAIDAMTALLAGEHVDLTGVPVDLGEATPFERRVYDAARAVGPGDTVTYGELTRRIGEDNTVARAVGQALGRNPVPIVVPCHRIVSTGGGLGGFSATGGPNTKRKLLAIEGAAVVPPSLFD